MSVIVAFYFRLCGDPINDFLLRSMFLRDQQKAKREDVCKNDQSKAKLLRHRKHFQLPQVAFLCLRSGKDRKMMAVGIDRIEKELEIDRFLKN